MPTSSITPWPATSALPSRRRFIARCGCSAAALFAGIACPTGSFAEAAASAAPRPTARQALDSLAAGNARFASDAHANTLTDAQRRLAVARSQSPMAVLVGCSDSRVSPELLFGRGLGELFIVRNAGNTVDEAGQGSIEYAVSELAVPLIVVMGHERCGAVAAAVAVVQKNARFPAAIGRMVRPILPAVLEAKAALDLADRPYDTDALVDASVRCNVLREVSDLRLSSSILTTPLAEGRLTIIGARYDLDSGRVDFFDH